MGELILKSLLLCCLVGAICTWAFMWLNAKESSIDDHTYDDNFDATKAISNVYIKKVRVKKQVRQFALSTSNNKKMLKVSSTAPLYPQSEESISEGSNSDFIEAEIIKANSK
jgi:hypothetical protein